MQVPRLLLLPSLDGRIPFTKALFGPQVALCA